MRTTLAWASLVRHRTRTILAILGVAVSTAMLLDMVMLANGMRESFRDLMLVRGFQLRLSPKGTLPFDTDAMIAGASGIVTTLRSNPQIDKISPILGASLHVDSKRGPVTSVGLGVNPSQQGDYQLLSGQDATTPDAIVVNDAFLKAAGAKVGDTLDVAVGYDPQLRTYAGKQRLVVTGIANFLYMATGQLGAAIPLATLQAMQGERAHDHVSLFMVRAEQSADIEAVRTWIEQHVPKVTALSTQSAMAKVDERLSYFRQLAFILGAVSVVVGFLLVSTLMTVSVNERVGEISVMRALGISTSHIVQQIMLEGFVITAIGATLGLGLGLVTARYLNSILADFPGLPTAIDFFLFQPKSAYSALGMLLGAGVIAGIYPAWRAANLPIAGTLRREAIA